MAYKSKIISYMRAQASLFPKDIGDLFFLTEDKAAIEDAWDEEKAKQVCKKIYQSLEAGSLDDRELCPFCVHNEGKCNIKGVKCRYFMNHGCCYTKHSDYFIITTLLNGLGDKTAGIFNYIYTTHGDKTIAMLKRILFDESGWIPKEVPPEPDPEPLIA